MKSRTRRTSILVFLAVLGYGAGLWAIDEFLSKDPLSTDSKAERLIDRRLSGGELDGRLRRYRRALLSSGDPAHRGLLVAMGWGDAKPADSAKRLTEAQVLDAVLLERAGKMAKDSLLAMVVGTNPDSARFLMPIYWALKDLGIHPGDSTKPQLPPGFVKSLAKGLHRHDDPFKAAELFAECMKADPDDPELPAWYGSALTKRALFVESSLDKIHMVKDGVKYLDKAVYDHPDYGAVRYIRANTYSALPGVFQKDALLREDLVYLIDAMARGASVKMSVAGGAPIDAPVSADQLRIVLPKALPMFAADKEFHETLRKTLESLESKQ